MKLFKFFLFMLLLSSCSESIVTIDNVRTEYSAYYIAKYSAYDYRDSAYDYWDEIASETYFVETFNGNFEYYNCKEYELKNIMCSPPEIINRETHTSNTDFDEFFLEEELNIYAKLNTGHEIKIAYGVYDDYINNGKDITREYIANKVFGTITSVKLKK